MSQLIQRDPRKLLPRWRSPITALRLRERDPLTDQGSRVIRPDHHSEMARLRAAWLDNQTPTFARGLLDGAMVTGLFHYAQDTAHSVLGVTTDPATCRIARVILGEECSHDTPDTYARLVEIEHRSPDPGIAFLRRRLRMMPRDPLTWVTLARRHFVHGYKDLAERELRIAHAMAPNDRYVARAAARFFLHYRRLDDAAAVLRRTPTTLHDPWLMAVGILIGRMRDGSHTLVKRGIAMLERQAFPPRAVSELATLVGTVERAHGKARAGRRWLRLALMDPTENVVAQMQYLRRRVTRGGDWEAEAFEARAWWSLDAQDVAASADALTLWQKDEPFSHDAALLGAWVHGTAAGDFQKGLSGLRSARRVCPLDPSLIAQETYVRAELGDLRGAEQLLAKRLPLAIRTSGESTDDIRWAVPMAADRGMIAFRRGRRKEGRFHYQNAVALAGTKRKHRYMATAARWHWIREECRGRELTPAMRSEWHDVHSSMSSIQRAVYGMAMERADVKAVDPPAAAQAL